MSNQRKHKDVIDVIFNGKPTKSKLKKLGISEDEFNKFMNKLTSSNTSKSYFRILADDEKMVMTTEAYGYLVKLLTLGSIDNSLFERIITLSLQMNVFLKKKINKEMMDDMVNYMIFSGQANVSVKDVLEMFFTEENEIKFNEEIN